jgi:tetratricopeptide (TPR) repeat protein
LCLSIFFEAPKKILKQSSIQEDLCLKSYNCSGLSSFDNIIGYVKRLYHNEDFSFFTIFIIEKMNYYKKRINTYPEMENYLTYTLPELKKELLEFENLLERYTEAEEKWRIFSENYYENKYQYEWKKALFFLRKLQNIIPYPARKSPREKFLESEEQEILNYQKCPPEYLPNKGLELLDYTYLVSDNLEKKGQHYFLYESAKTAIQYYEENIPKNLEIYTEIIKDPLPLTQHYVTKWIKDIEALKTTLKDFQEHELKREELLAQYHLHKGNQHWSTALQVLISLQQHTPPLRSQEQYFLRKEKVFIEMEIEKLNQK